MSAPPMSLDLITITSTRVPSTLGQETEGLTVITREQIERMAVANGADLLRQVTGVQVDQLGGPGGMSLAYIRGSDPNHVLVLIDGVRMNDPTNSRGGGFDLSGIDPSEVQRIEVLRGAASAIYGADAMGGVINVITRRGERGASASVATGGLGFRAQSARATVQASGGGWLSTSASTLRDGRDADGGRIKMSQVALAGRVVVDARARVDLQLRHSARTSSAFPDDSGGNDLAVIRILERRRSHGTSFSMRGVAEVQSWILSLEGTGFERQEGIESPGVAPGARSDFGIPASSSATRYRRDSALFSAVRHMSRGNELVLGGEYLREHGTSKGVYELFGTHIPADFNLQRDTRSAFTEFKWVASRKLIVRAGLRHDSIGGNESGTSPSMGARYSFAGHDGDIIASYSEGFKPPSFFALGLPSALGGNSSLKAEHSKGLSIGYEKRLPNGLGEASVAVFRRKYADLVTFDNETNRLVNAEHVVVEGLELTIEVRASASLGLKAHYTRLTSQVAPSDQPLRQRPGTRAGIEATWQFVDRAQLVWRSEYADQIFDSSIPTGNLFLRTYFRNDLTVTYAVNPKVKVFTAIDNFFDRHNQWYVGARSQARRVRFGTTLAF